MTHNLTTQLPPTEGLPWAFSLIVRLPRRHALSTSDVRSLCRRNTTRSGQALVEFAIIALALTFLLAAILSMGQMFYAAQIIQQAADVGAQELARMPLNPMAQFDNPNDPTDSTTALANTQVVAQIYDETKLYVSKGTMGGKSLFQYASDENWPLINRLLMPLMFYDLGLDAYRYPGTIVSGPSGTTVRVLVPNGSGGYAWHPVVEEIRSSPDDASTGHYSVTSSSTLPGTVQLRINYPFQAAGLIAYQPSASNPLVASTDPTTPLLADDSAVSITNSLPSGYTLESQSLGTQGSGFGNYAGEYGLGQMVAWGSQAPGGVRPFRRVVTGQGVYRREVFGP